VVITGKNILKPGKSQDRKTSSEVPLWLEKTVGQLGQRLRSKLDGKEPEGL
jgi:hypothetical protein